MGSEAALAPAVRYHLEHRADEPFFRSQADEVLRRIPAQASPVLDLACATAPLAPRLIGRGHEYVGTDRDPEMLSGAAERLAGGPGKLVRAEAEQLPFDDQSFGAVACLGLFEYLEDPVAVLAEVRRVLRPDGVLVITVPRREAPYRRAQAGIAPLLRLLGRSDPFDLRSGRDVSGDTVRSWAADAGLRLTAEAHVAPAVLPWPLDRFLPRLAQSLAGRAGPRWGTARVVELAVTSSRDEERPRA